MSMKLMIDENNLEFSLLLKNDDTGNVIESGALEEGFRKQNKRHITILGGVIQKLLKNILEELPLNESLSALDKINKILKSLQWRYELREIYRIKKAGHFDNDTILENRESYIMMIDMPDIKVFYRELNRLLKTNFPVQVPHITLFTKGERKNPSWYGIPVPSIEEFNSMQPEKIS